MVLVLLLAQACSGQHRRRSRDPVRRPLAAAEALYDQRADPERLDEAVAAFEALFIRFPRDRRVVSGLARAHIARAEGYPGRDLEDLDRAREVGFVCLRLRVEVDELVRSSKGMLTVDALTFLEADDIPCVEVASRAWLRWMEERGAGGAGLDVEIVQALVERELTLAGANPGVHALVDEGLAWSLPREGFGADRDRAGAAFLAAAQLASARRRITLDRARYVLAPQGDLESYRGTLLILSSMTPEDGDLWLMENRAAVDLAKELLAGPDPVEDPPLP